MDGESFIQQQKETSGLLALCIVLYEAEIAYVIYSKMFASKVMQSIFGIILMMLIKMVITKKSQSVAII
jgi:hypothetical protein